MDVRQLIPSTVLALMINTDLNDEQLNRYSRHILLPEIDLDGQARILAARIAIVGAGGLGTPAATYLNASGIGQLTIIDDDAVDLGNLQRQIAYTSADIQKPKVQALKLHLQAQNSEPQIDAKQERATPDILLSLAEQHDLVIDATDNFETRFHINRACVDAKIPLVSGSATQFDGQVLSIRPGQACYNCIYEEQATEEEQNCSNLGVLSPLTGIIGSIQAAEALKIITGAGKPLYDRLLKVDSLSMEFKISRVRRDPNCPTCSPAQKNNA